jgi:hypothetical protein
MFRCYTSDMSKFIAGLLYISKRLIELGGSPDFYRIFKIMYFSDRKSLPQYYQNIFGNWHALPDGPAPENLYQLIKKVRDGKEIKEFSLENNDVIPKIDPDMEEFSETDIECIDASISENWKLSYGELREKSHGFAWENTARGYEMNLLDIVKESGANSQVIEHIKERVLNCSPAQLESSF